jgi:hypothetical protein
MFSARDAIDNIKEKNKSIRSERDELKNQFDSLRDSMGQLQNRNNELQYYRENNLGLFFKENNIRDDEIFAYANAVYDARKDPSKQNQLTSDMNRVHQTYRSNIDNRNKNSTFERERYELHTTALDMAMNMPDIAATAKAWDARVGEPGDFLRQVQSYGYLKSVELKKDITPFEAARAINEKLSKIIETQQSTGNGGSDNSDNRRVNTSQRKPTIPNTSGGGSRSPARRRPKDVDEFDAYAERRIAELNME